MFPKKLYICFVYIFFSLQVKRSVIISNKHGIYEFPRKLANELKHDGFCSPYKDKFQHSGSSEIRKDQENIKALQNYNLVPNPPLKIKTLSILAKNCEKIEIKIFPQCGKRKLTQIFLSMVVVVIKKNLFTTNAAVVF